MSAHLGNELELIEFLKTIDTPTVANAIETLDVCSHSEGFPSLNLRCLFPELGVMCGYAVTAHVETVTDANPKSESAFLDLFEAVERSTKPAVVVFQEIGGDRDRAVHCGEVMSTIFRSLGGIGLVSDCAVRDLSAVRKLRFHYFARGAVSSHANFRIVRSNVPCEVLGMTVHPGDLLHGDENGIIRVPGQKREALPDAIQRILSAERKILDLACESGFTAGALRDRLLH
ncbi:MAG TPA: RraA family protein [Bryobacteraceae bacterium]|jgi:regulator of RNase E activity RraA|nr:RraA family protein [Bryobacteraceae bacterium]